MPLLARRALTPLPVVLLVLTAFVIPATAQENDPVGLDPEDGPSFVEARQAMDAIMFEFSWLLDLDTDAEATRGLMLEIALLRELDAFAGSVPAIEQIHQGFGPWPTEARDTTLDRLFEIDDDLADVKLDVIAQVDVPPALAEALDEMNPGSREQLVGGARAFIPTENYLEGLATLLSMGTAHLLESDRIATVMRSELSDALLALADGGGLPLFAPGPTGDFGLLPPGAGADTGQLPPRTQIGPEAEPDEHNGPPWLLIAMIAGGGAAVGMFVAAMLTRQRRGDESTDHGSDHITNQILEAHRLLTAVVDESTIVEIGCGTAVAITGAHDAMILRRVADGLRRAGETGVFTRSIVSRVIETGQPLLATVEDDPAVGGPVAICAVPLVADGAVNALLVVRSSPEHPFDTEDRRRLELLAPALGGALLSADALDSFEYMAMVDGLTSLGNRRRLDGDLETVLIQAVDHDQPVGFAMIDVDHFKTFNDTHGHAAGDHALQTVARVIAGAVRAGDIVYRYGGEEFSVLLPGASASEAADVAERIRAAVQAEVIPGEESQPGGRLTVSVGIATLDKGDAQSLKQRADTALYEAKARGRNRSVTS